MSCARLMATFKRLCLGALLLISGLQSNRAAADEVSQFETQVTFEIPFKEKVVNFSAIYATQWLVYLTTQHETIETHGKFENWLKYPLRPHFDMDDFEYNLVQHSLTGHYYYLFYRSRGYDIKDAFLASFLSSAAFEFTIETFTERPSYQDLYQTPVFGTVLGIGVERASQFLKSSNHWFLRGVGYVLNPFFILPQTSTLISLRPYTSSNSSGVLLSAEF